MAVWNIDLLTRAEIDVLLRASSRRAASGRRDRALIALLFGAGLRIAEALALTPKDLDLEAGAVTVHRGKGAKRRVVGLDEGAAAIVREWLATREKLGAAKSAAVFCLVSRGRVGEPLAAANVRQMLRRRAERAGLDKRIHPHGLRHAHAAELARDGVPIHVIQAQLGHANAATTSRYIAHLRPEDVIRAVRTRASLEQTEPR